jgi:DNA-binding beta-propeller fold protein YncE
VTSIAIAMNRPAKSIKVGAGATAIAITPDGKTAYVASFDAGTVTPITVATSTPGRPIHVGKGAFALAILP